MRVIQNNANLRFSTWKLHSNLSRIRSSPFVSFSFQRSQNVLTIHGWKLLHIVKKVVYSCLYLHKNVVVSTYINVELLSNVDKINTLTSENNSNLMLKNCNVSSVFWIWSALEQSRNRIPDRWYIIHTFLLISTPETRLTWEKFKICFLFFLFFVSFFFSFLFPRISGNLDQRIIFLAPRQLWKLSYPWYIWPVHETSWLFAYNFLFIVFPFLLQKFLIVYLKCS